MTIGSSSKYKWCFNIIEWNKECCSSKSDHKLVMLVWIFQCSVKPSLTESEQASRLIFCNCYCDRFLKPHTDTRHADTNHVIGWQKMTQPIKSNIDYCLIQSSEWSLLLISQMIAYIKTAFYSSESIHPINMKFLVHIDFLVE